MAPGIRTATLGGSNPSTEGLETWENDVASPPNSRPKSPWRVASGDSATLRAATRVNAEQASKHLLRKPTRL